MMNNNLKTIGKISIFLVVYLLFIIISLFLNGTLLPLMIISLGILSIIFVYIYPQYSIFLILICTEKYLYIADSNIVLSTSFDIVLIVSIILSIRYFTYRCKNKRRFSKYIIITIAILIVSIIISNMKFGQPILYCIVASRYMLLYMIYFPLSKYVEKYGSEYLLIAFMWFGFGVAILFLIQMVIYPIIIFKLNYSFRFGNIRSYDSLIIISLSCLIGFSKFLYESIIRRKVIYMIVVIVDLAELILFSQTRSAIIVLMVTLIFGLLTYNSKNKFSKIGLIILICIIIFTLFNDYFANLLTSTFMEITNSEIAKDGTLNVRVLAISFMLNQVKLSPIFGLGYYFSGYGLSSYITGSAYGYYFGDVGVFGYIFHMGILGVIVSILYYLKMFKVYKKLNKVTSEKMLFKLFLFFIFGISTFNYFFAINNLIIYLIIFTCSLEGAYNEENKCGRA